jgi:hypothetical protein
MVVSSTCPDEGFWRSALIIGCPEKAIRCYTPI